MIARVAVPSVSLNVRENRGKVAHQGDGMQIERRFTKEGQDPWADVPFEARSSKIVNPDGRAVFSLENIQVPQGWSQVAVDILAQKYFRKAGVPEKNRKGSRRRLARMDSKVPSGGGLPLIRPGG